MVVGIGVTLAAGAMPALLADADSIKRALESYGITPTYGQGRLDRILQRVVVLPPLAAMSVRNLARRKSRVLVTMVVIGVAVATFLAAEAVGATVNTAIDQLFQTYRADVWVWFSEYVGENFRGIEQRAGRDAGGSVVAARCVGVFGHYGERWQRDDGPELCGARSLVGTARDDAVVHAEPASRALVSRGETDGVVISTDLAQALGLHWATRLTWIRAATRGRFR